jgi:hypothetical protein
MRGCDWHDRAAMLGGYREPGRGEVHTISPITSCHKIWRVLPNKSTYLMEDLA